MPFPMSYKGSFFHQGNWDPEEFKDSFFKKFSEELTLDKVDFERVGNRLSFNKAPFRNRLRIRTFGELRVPYGEGFVEVEEKKGGFLITYYLNFLKTLGLISIALLLFGLFDAFILEKGFLSEKAVLSEISYLGLVWIFMVGIIFLFSIGIFPSFLKKFSP